MLAATWKLWWSSVTLVMTQKMPLCHLWGLCSVLCPIPDKGPSNIFTKEADRGEAQVLSAGVLSAELSLFIYSFCFGGHT